jgi:MYXO-CTERM domain-containing protein
MRRLLVSAVIATSLTATAMAVADEPAAPTYAPEKPAAPVVEAPATLAAALVAAPGKPAAPAVPAKPSAPTVAAAATVTAKPPAAVAAPVKEAAAVATSTPPAPVVAAAPAAVAAAAGAAAAPAGPAAKEPEPPLALRPSTPLALASEPAPTPWIYKAAFGAALLAAGVILWRRRRNVTGKRSAAPAMRVLGKTAMGLRGELALVEVGGMRLVVGITSGSMQTLAILPDDYVLEDAKADAETRATETAASAANDTGKPRFDLASRARSLFAGIDLGPPDPLRVGGASAFSASRYGADAFDDAPDSAPAPRTRPREVRDARDESPARDERTRRLAPRDAPLEGQARGIALALRNRR